MRQKLVTKFVPIEQIYPQWVMHLAKMKSLRKWYFSPKKREFLGTDNKFYEISDGKTCIVAEAHGNGDYDDCDDCQSFSYYTFMRISSLGKMNEALKEFAVHWNKEHL